MRARSSSIRARAFSIWSTATARHCATAWVWDGRVSAGREPPKSSARKSGRPGPHPRKWWNTTRRPRLTRTACRAASAIRWARALYLFQGNKDTLYRIHGTNEPKSIGKAVSSGCIRMLNQDVIDLYDRVPLGSPVVVLNDANATHYHVTTESPARMCRCGISSGGPPSRRRSRASSGWRCVCCRFLQNRPPMTSS
ncbi:MAG: L,D-transpeptidase [Breoghania sp.]|nr:L,D-transpeptidase [Breoghania sp.]MDJ0933218.1 L,D-transpeptidase [Breoghania sp.]